MLSLSSQSFHIGYALGASPEESARILGTAALANRFPVLGVSAGIGERHFQRGGVKGQLDGVQVGKLTNFQGGHGHELAVDSFSAADSLGLSENSSSGGFGGNPRKSKKASPTGVDAESIVSSELSVLSGHIVLVVWQSVELFLALLWKLLLSLTNKLLGYQEQSMESISFEQPSRNDNVFAIRVQKLPYVRSEILNAG